MHEKILKTSTSEAIANSYLECQIKQIHGEAVTKNKGSAGQGPEFALQRVIRGIEAKPDAHGVVGPPPGPLPVGTWPSRGCRGGRGLRGGKNASFSA